MRILHVFDHSTPLQSGYVTRSLAILHSQRQRGWETIHLTSPRHGRYGGQQVERETVDDLDFNRTPLEGQWPPVLQELREMRATRARLAALAASARPDVLHAHSPVLNTFPAISVGREMGVPVVYEVRALWEDAAVDHGSESEGSPRYLATRWLDTRAMFRAQWIVALCEPLRREIVARGVPEARVSVVPNAVDPQFLGAASEAEPDLRAKLGLAGKTVLGFIGSFYAYEGIDLLIDALAMLRAKRDDLRVLLVGGGPEDEKLRARVAKEGLGELVVFTGRVKLDQVMRYYPLIDLFVFPRRKMRLTDLVTPLKPLEAMAQRRPVLASDVGGHRELVRHDQTGFLVRADDPRALAAAIETVLADPARLQRIVEAGRRFVEGERNWDRVSANYADIYGKITEGAKRNGAG